MERITIILNRGPVYTTAARSVSSAQYNVRAAVCIIMYNNIVMLVLLLYMRAPAQCVVRFSEIRGAKGVQQCTSRGQLFL